MTVKQVGCESLDWILLA